MAFFSHNSQKHAPRTHPGRPARALGKRMKPEPGDGFQIPDGPPGACSLAAGGAPAGDQRPDREAPACERTLGANGIGGTGSGLTTRPRGHKLPRYDSGAVFDSQLHVNLSETGNEDDYEVQGTDRRALGRRELPRSLVCRPPAAASQPRSLFTAFEQTSFPPPTHPPPPPPCFTSQPCLCWIAQSDLAGSKGMSLKNNQTSPGVRGPACQEWLRSRKLSACPLGPHRPSRGRGWAPRRQEGTREGARCVWPRRGSWPSSGASGSRPSPLLALALFGQITPGARWLVGPGQALTPPQTAAHLQGVRLP